MLNTLAPVRDLVLLRSTPSQQSAAGQRTDGTHYELLLPSVAQHETPIARVLAVGPDATVLPVGSLVLYDPTHATRADSSSDIQRIGKGARGNSVSKPALVLVPLSDILALIEN